MKTTLLSLLILFSLIKIQAQPVNYKPDAFMDSSRTEKMKAVFPAIKNMYEAYVRENRVPGLAFGIVSAGKLLYSGSVGFQEVPMNRPVTSTSVFRIASMTKSFTAMAILKLRDAGKLDLDDPVVKYIPELGKTALLATDAKPITIRNLLTHTAGFPEDNPWADRQLDKTDAELMAFVSHGISMAYIPGQNFEYSNLGFALLGHIITKVSRMPFDEYITANILKPLNMNHTYWEYGKVPTAELVHGYRLINGQWKEEKLLHSGAFGSTGGLLTSVGDFSKYMILHLSAWPAGADMESSPVMSGTIREMHAQGIITRLRRQTRNANGVICPTMTSYNDGLGSTKDCSGRLTIQHSGGLPGFGSNWAFLPDYDIAVVSMTNLTYATSNQLDIKVLDTLINMAGLKPRVIHTSSVLQDRQKQLLQILPAWNDVKANVFSENFFKDYFIDSLRKEAEALFTKIGKVTEVSDVIPVNQLRGYFTLTGETGKLDVWFTLSPEKPALIQEYKISEH
ncbi:MAG TPA: serine hydrolase domain-containing protein [Cyclobacteriaceae bacterium]|nr:serine hydrolase domain-containing protein [Cyclobacteriaceae bacterium]